MKNNNYNLFLDDLREPWHAYIIPDNLEGIIPAISLEEVSKIKNEDWIIVRNYSQFRNFIDNNGVPRNVSYDIDLANEHYRGDFSRNPSGMDCFKYLVDYCETLGSKPPENMWVHSYNVELRPILRQKIKKWKEKA
jgi:hypothetical protein